ncbi:MAG: hypothetical protein HDS14_08330 [Bacteroides sp.]|nr:hypothetical protein [Bacteroides sp.]
MKAKLRGTTGAYFDVVEVNAILVKDSIPFMRYYADDEGTIYKETVLEFLPGELKEVTIEGWVCRDGYDGDVKDSILHLYLKDEPFPDNDRPERISSVQMWRGANGLHLPSEMYPKVTWDSEPKRVKIIITPIEE